MAIVVEISEQIIEGKIMPVGFELPAFESMPIIDVGSN